MTGEQLRQTLRDANINLAELATKLDKSPQSLNQALNAADVKSGLLEQIGEAVGIPVHKLYGEHLDKNISCIPERMSGAERITEILAYLNINAKELSEKCGYDKPQAFYDVINGKTKNVSPTMCEKILSVFPVFNRVWLLTGEGCMLSDSADSRMIPPSGKFIRYWKDIDATGGGLESFNDVKSDYEPVVLPDFSDCTDAVNIVGESMEPTYKSGSIIVLKEWKENFIIFGNAYLIITRNGNRMVKYIREGSDASKIKCVSENPNYDPFEIDKQDILRLYVVKGVISKLLM